MPKSIFSKLLTAYIVVLVLSFMISAVSLNLFLSDFISREKVNLLKQSGDRINSFLSIYVDSGPGNPLGPMLENVLKNYSENMNAMIWVASPTGEIIFMTRQKIPVSVLRQLTQDGIRYRLPDERQYAAIDRMEGKVETGDFYGLFAQTGVAWATVVRPFYHERFGGGKEFLGAVYLSTPLPEINTAHYGIIKYFLISITISALITILIVTFISKKISRPIILLKNAAKSIAVGKMQDRIPVTSNDEIGELTHSFNDMAEELCKTEMLRRNFIANVSHDLRTPMTSIQGFVEGMLDGTIPQEKFPEYLRLVSDETTRLNKMANDILDLAKMEAGQMAFQSIAFGINECMRRCIIKLERSIEEKNLDLIIDLQASELTVLGDPDAMERVITNLLHNAVKFTPAFGSLEIRIWPEKEKVYVSIADNGMGIGEEDLPRIWERFYKSDPSRGVNKEGSGLGLSIVKTILQGHGQEIHVQSKQGEGSRFVFSLQRKL